LNGMNERIKWVNAQAGAHDFFFFSKKDWRFRLRSFCRVCGGDSGRGWSHQKAANIGTHMKLTSRDKEGERAKVAGQRGRKLAKKGLLACITESQGRPSRVEKDLGDFKEYLGWGISDSNS